MKKTLVLLIALTLVCTSVFAGISVTAGAGFGGHIIPKKDALLAEGKIPGWTYEYGPVVFAGVDYEEANGLTFYGDTGLNLIAPTKLNKVFDEFKKENILSDPADVVPFYKGMFELKAITQNIGAGYTFHFTKQISLMVGAGLDAKVFFVKANIPAALTKAKEEYADVSQEAADALAYVEAYEKAVKEVAAALNKTLTVGFNARIKASYQVDEQWSVSFQLNPSFDVKIINSKISSLIDVKDDANPYRDGIATGMTGLFKAAMTGSGYALIGATYKF